MSVVEGSSSDYEQLPKEVAIPRYDMESFEAGRLCTEFLNTEEALRGTKLGCYKFEAESEFSNLGRYVESTVFYETFGNNPKLMEQEYGPYENASEFYVVIDHEQRSPVGVMRIIKPSEAGLKSLVDLNKINIGFTQEDVYREYDLDPAKCVDIATLCILPEYRGSNGDFTPSKLMYRTLYLSILNNPNFDHVVTIIDKKAERNLKTLKFPFEPIFDSDYFSYLDSPESHLLIAENALFYPELAVWVEKLRTEATETDSDLKTFIAETINSLINTTDLDDMLAKSVARY